MVSGARPVQFIIICLAVCSLAFFWGKEKPKDLPDDFSFVAIDGTTHHAETLKRGVLVMTVGAAWCPECKNEAPAREKAHQTYKDKGVRFISVLGNSSDEQIRDFVQTYKLTFPVGKDKGIAEAFGVRVIPQTFVFSREGKLVKRFVGEVSYKELCSHIEKALAAPAR